MRKKLTTKLLSLTLLIGAITLTGCSNSKEDFAPKLAEDIIDTWSKGAEKNKGKELSFFRGEDYEDIGRGISVHRKAMDLTGGLGGLGDLIGGFLGGKKEEPDQTTGLAEQIALRAELQRKGYDIGLNMGGYIDLKDYDTGFGELENQQLGWGFNSTGKLITCHVKGTVVNDDKKPIEVDYKFQLDNDSNGLSSSTIKMLGGAIKDGEDVTQVPVD
ncbi:hypothetical protein [Spirosoma jeollabukense]